MREFGLRWRNHRRFMAGAEGKRKISWFKVSFGMALGIGGQVTDDLCHRAGDASYHLLPAVRHRLPHRLTAAIHSASDIIHMA